MDIIAFTMIITPALAITWYMELLVQIDLDLYRTMARTANIERQRSYEVEL